jgi:hypothetical protein
MIEALFPLYGMISLPLRSHSSNQLHTLDLCIFSITKLQIVVVNRVESSNIRSKHIAHIVCSRSDPDAMPAEAVL